MELQIWMGRAGAGKSRRVLETMQERRQRPQILLVPEHASHEAELDLCRALGPTASRDAEVLSFRNLATRVMAQTGGLADVTLDAGGKLLTMRRALQEVSSRLTVFARPSQRPAFLRQLVALADELYAYQVTPEMLLAQVADMEGAAGDKLRSAALIYDGDMIKTISDPILNACVRRNYNPPSAQVGRMPCLFLSIRVSKAETAIE